MGRFDDIINKPYIKSSERKHMSLSERAAQFGAFRAVSGHEDALYETARITEERAELDEYKKAELNEKLKYIRENPKKEEAEIVYFSADEKKQGGKYISKKGFVIKVREYERDIIFEDGERILIDEIVDIIT